MTPLLPWPNYYRWRTGEWAYESEGTAFFQQVQECLNPPGRDDEADEMEWTAFQEQVLATMRDALRDLDAEGFFGNGEERQQVTLFLTMSDADDMLALENASAQALNPAPVYERFAARYGLPA